MEKKLDNHLRLELITKGFLNINDIERFIPCGYKKAKLIYTEIIINLASQSKIVSPFGVSVNSFLQYIGMTEKQIRQYVEDERLLMDRS